MALTNPHLPMPGLSTSLPPSQARIKQSSPNTARNNDSALISSTAVSLNLTTAGTTSYNLAGNLQQSRDRLGGSSASQELESPTTRRIFRRSVLSASERLQRVLEKEESTSAEQRKSRDRRGHTSHPESPRNNRHDNMRITSSRSRDRKYIRDEMNVVNYHDQQEYQRTERIQDVLETGSSASSSSFASSTTDHLDSARQPLALDAENSASASSMSLEEEDEHLPERAQGALRSLRANSSRHGGMERASSSKAEYHAKARSGAAMNDYIGGAHNGTGNKVVSFARGRAASTPSTNGVSRVQRKMFPLGTSTSSCRTSKKSHVDRAGRGSTTVAGGRSSLFVNDPGATGRRARDHTQDTMAMADAPNSAQKFLYHEGEHLHETQVSKEPSHFSKDTLHASQEMSWQSTPQTRTILYC
ncbi:unnamed protein product [Amoebophrya sp. A25]|nr:unnamed protein product [Amoebophrya sp. A25]|eukprot:GSA25T00014198001.1